MEGEEEIVEKFREVYSDLYNSADTSEAMFDIKQKLRDMIGPDAMREVDKIAGNVVKNAAKRMRPGKNDVSESFSSDLLCHAPDSMFEALAAVFRSWLIHGTVTKHLLVTAFLPLLKSSLKDPSNMDSYRPIAGSSQVLKLFDYVFSKLLSRKVPPIVIRTLIFNYEEQVAWVKWGNTKSSQFKVANGTKQGSVLSSFFWNVYLDDLLKELRVSGFGCYIAGVFMGATAYANDLLLLSPTRSGMAEMLKICEKYTGVHNIAFSVDDNPAKSKTKVIYVCGSMTFRAYPFPLQLNGRNLPYVTTCLHLGHILSQDGSMTQDCLSKRAQYIDKTVDIRNMFSFADPTQMLTAVDKYASDYWRF